MGEMSRTKLLLLFLILTLATLAGFSQGDYQKGISYYQQKQYEKAIVEFEAIVKDQPKYEFGHRVLGLSYLSVRKYDRAISSFQKAVELTPDNFVSLSGLALAYFNSGRYRQALGVLSGAERYAKTPRDQYRLYRTKGAAAFNLHDFPQAADSLKKAVAIQRGDANDLLQLGISYYHLGELDESSQFLSQVVAMRPNSVEAKKYLAQLESARAVAAIDEGRYQEAVDILREHVEANSEDVEAWFNLGLAFVFTENLQAAEGAFQRVTRLSPDNAGAYDRLGYIYEMKKLLNKSLQAYKKAFELGKTPETQASIDRIEKRIKQSGQ
jgi:tetratricopeptide (TPR) repeat protein